MIQEPKIMAWSEPMVMCKIHPGQRQQPGICSSCLREKLAKLPSLRYDTMVIASRTSSFSSSTCMSPTKDNLDHLHEKKSLSFAGSNSFGRNGLRKSRSSYVGRRRSRNIGGDGKKKEGFWSKLIRSTSVKTKGVFVHSNKTSNERSVF